MRGFDQRLRDLPDARLREMRCGVEKCTWETSGWPP